MTKIHFRPYIPNQTVLFPQRIDEDIAENDPVRHGWTPWLKGSNLESFSKPNNKCGPQPLPPQDDAQPYLYADMNNIYSCRKLKKPLYRDIHEHRACWK